MSKKRPVKAMFPDIHELSSDQIASSGILKDLLKTEVPKAISSAHKEKKIYASVFEINNTGYFIEIHKKDWVSALETCVVFNVEHEDYATCAEITDLINQIKSNQKSPKIKLSKND